MRVKLHYNNTFTVMNKDDPLLIKRDGEIITIKAQEVMFGDRLVDKDNNIINFSIELTNEPLGTYKLIEDITTEDILIGPDGEDRRVEETHTGEDEMYEIESNGKKFIVNERHRLILTNGKDILEIPLVAYLELQDTLTDYELVSVKEEGVGK